MTHMKETKQIIQFMKDCDAHPSMVEDKYGSGSGGTASSVPSNQTPPAAHQTQYSSLQHSFNAPQQHTYSSSSSVNENRWASSSSSNNAANTSGSSSNNNLFNKLYYSGR